MADVASNKRFGITDIGQIILRGETEEPQAPTSWYPKDFSLWLQHLSASLRSLNFCQKTGQLVKTNLV